MTWDMTQHDWIEALKPHAGHHIECQSWKTSDGEGCLIVCEDCNQTLIDTDDYAEEE